MKKLLILIASFAIIAGPSQASSGDFIANVADRVADHIGTTSEYLLANEDRRLLFATTVGAYSTLLGPGALTMLPGVYTSVAATYATLLEISERNDRDMSALREDAIDYLADGRKSHYFSEFAAGVRQSEETADFSDEKIAGIIIASTVQ